VSPRVLVTGADGFAGSYLVRAMLKAGWQVCGTILKQSPSTAILTQEEVDRVEWRKMDLADTGDIREASAGNWDYVVHLAALSDSPDAEKDPGSAWNINAAGTARLMDALWSNADAVDPRILVVSTSEVYGEGRRRPKFREVDSPRPLSWYAVSKVGTEAAGMFGRNRGLKVIVARPWPHTGPGDRRLIGKWVQLLSEPDAPGKVPFGSPGAVRDYLDVRDVADAYLRLLKRGKIGEVYNVASGVGMPFKDRFALLTKVMGAKSRLVKGTPRKWDAHISIGNPRKLQKDTGWIQKYNPQTTFSDMKVDAQTH
jgi:nucleoside-diphosphate-sugar epimerase